MVVKDIRYTGAQMEVCPGPNIHFQQKPLELQKRGILRKLK